MKINEASVIDNKVIDYAIRTLIADGNHVLAQELKSQLKPLEPIVRDAWNCGEEIVQHEIHLDEFCHHNCDHINPKYVTVDQYINQTEI